MFRHAHWFRTLAAALITALLIWVVYANWKLIVSGIDEMRAIPWYIVGAGIWLVFVTFGLAAASYASLAFRRLKWSELGIVELSAAFVNRLVPSGLGGLGVHGLYLHNRNHTAAEATTIVSVNNLLGMLVHGGLLFLLLIVVRPAADFHPGLPISQGWILLGVVSVLGVMLLAPVSRRRIIRFGQSMVQSLRHYQTRPHKIIVAAAALCFLTLTNTLILYLIATALGIPLDWAAIFVVFSVGILLGAVVPTPGGFGGVEAGLIAGFMAYGVSSEQAIAAALAFRLITYWFPLLPGGIALIIAQRQRLFSIR